MVMTDKSQKILKISAIVLGVLTLGTFVFLGIRRLSRRRNKVLGKKGVLVCSHITKIDVPQALNVENNLANIQLCLDNDVEIIEMDIQITKDGVPVLFHDNDLDSKTNGNGSISNKTWSEVSQIRYISNTSQGIATLESAIQLLKKSRKSAIYQLDKCSQQEIGQINKLGLFKGVENQILCKGFSWQKPQTAQEAGILWMPMIPTDLVGKMSNMETINKIVANCQGSEFLEAQFSDQDSLLIDGTLSKELQKIGCNLFVVAVAGASTTNGKSFRGDSPKQWEKMIKPMGAKAIMTNKPIALKNFLQQFGV
jgi:hypothetical protein